MKTKNVYITIVLSVAFLALLLSIRMVVTKSLFFGFYVWNSFLAILPIFLSSYLVNGKLTRPVSLLVFIIWLLFFPNAAYLVTDVLHFKEKKGMPLWFDLILVIQASWIGLFATTVSLKQINIFLYLKLGNKLALIGIIIIIILTSYGVYLGRFLRFNSWDFLTNPNLIINETLDRVVHPFSHIRTWFFVFVFSLFIGLKYLFYNVNYDEISKKVM